MSHAKIRAALEQALAAITPAIETQWENVPFLPTEGVTYQRVNLLPVDVENPSIGPDFKRYRGIFQVTLCCPAGKGTKEAADRAEKIEQTFAIDQTFPYSGVTVRMEASPDVRPGYSDDDRWCVPISIRYYADI